MPVYKYVAVNAQKQKVKGKFIADNEKELASSLAKKNLYLVSATVEKEGANSNLFNIGKGKVQLKDLPPFCRQFSIMVTAGIPILDCLESLKKQNYSYHFKMMLQTVYDDVKGGAMLSNAFDKHAKALPNFFRSMVHVGEASGKLDEVFESLANYYESDEKVKRKVKSALSYPLMLLIMTVAIVILMLSFVVPTFKDTMLKMEVDPEGFTKKVYDMSEFLTLNWKILLLGVVFVFVLIFLLLQTKGGKYAFDVFKIHCPFFGQIGVNLIAARFTRALSILLSSGMTLAEALDSVVLIIGNRYIQKRFKKALNDVKHGVTLTQALTDLHFFPNILLQMVDVGEKTATLAEVMTRSYQYFDARVEASLSSMTAKIQPIMLLIMGLVIGSLFLAVYSPMLSIMNQL